MLAVRDQLREPNLPTMLYGSMARGDEGPDSDIDVLQLAPTSRSAYRHGQLSVVAYPPAHLAALGRLGNLFVAHLAKEGKVLWDVDGALARALESFINPTGYTVHRQAIQITSMALDVTRETFDKNPSGFHRLGAYLLRSWATVSCAASGELVFAVPTMARLLGRPSLVKHLARSSIPSWLAFCELRDELSQATGSQIVNPHGSLEALAVWQHVHHPNASAHTVRLLSDSNCIPYEALRPASVL